MIKKYRNQVFSSPNNNVLCDGVNYEEALLSLNYETYRDDFNKTIFFKSINAKKGYLD